MALCKTAVTHAMEILQSCTKPSNYDGFNSQFEILEFYNIQLIALEDFQQIKWHIYIKVQP